MMHEAANEAWRYIDLISLDRIYFLNPRVRDKRKFNLLVDNISKVGLKRPITVSKRAEGSADADYDLVCGQGRIEAFRELKQTHIPAMVIEASKDDCLVMSLVENCARRQHTATELLQAVTNLRIRGYSDKTIAEKIGFSAEYVGMIGFLLENGEERLLSAVEAGTLSLSLATDIARADEPGAQAALMEAYTDGSLRGKKLIAVRRMLEQRSVKGKRRFEQAIGRVNPPRRHVTKEAMIKAYKEEASRQRLLTKKAQLTSDRLLFVVEAMRSLLGEADFVNLLKTQGLESVPSALKSRLTKG